MKKLSDYVNFIVMQMIIQSSNYKCSFFTWFLQALQYVEHRLGVLQKGAPVSLKSQQSTPKYTELRDIIFYLLDTFYTLQNFVSVYPPAAAVLHEKEVDVR